MQNYVIITAGGTGTRMGSETPKQFLELNGQPLIMRSIEAFHRYSNTLQIILVLPGSDMATWKDICSKYNFDIPHISCEGGDTRFASVKEGLAHVVDEGLVAVHDAVRPLVSEELISRCYDMAENEGNAVPVVPLRDSVREVVNGQNRAIARDRMRLVQTPQVFGSELLKKAYEQGYRNSFTDDASVVESLGIAIHLTEGEDDNIKITFPGDLLLAEALIKA